MSSAVPRTIDSLEIETLSSKNSLYVTLQYLRTVDKVNKYASSTT